jgi:hypothetical protein
MAELLVKAVSATHQIPAKDALCYKQLDPVVVMPDGHPLGTEERNTAKFWIIKLTGATVQEVLPYIQAVYDAQQQMTRRRRYTCAINLTGAVRAQLNAGPVTYTWTQAKKFITNKLTGVTAEAGG